MTGRVTDRGKCLSPLSRDTHLLWVGIFTGCRVFRSLCYARGNKNALNSIESRFLGDKIEMRRKLERERSSFFPQIEPRSASEK